MTRQTRVSSSSRDNTHTPLDQLTSTRQLGFLPSSRDNTHAAGPDNPLRQTWFFSVLPAQHTNRSSDESGFFSVFIHTHTHRWISVLSPANSGFFRPPGTTHTLLVQLASSEKPGGFPSSRDNTHTPTRVSFVLPPLVQVIFSDKPGFLPSSHTNTAGPAFLHPPTRISGPAYL